MFLSNGSSPRQWTYFFYFLPYLYIYIFLLSILISLAQIEKRYNYCIYKLFKLPGLYTQVVHCPTNNPNFRDITWNVEENETLHGILRVVSSFPHYTFRIISRKIDFLWDSVVYSNWCFLLISWLQIYSHDQAKVSVWEEDRQKAFEQPKTCVRSLVSKMFRLLNRKVKTQNICYVSQLYRHDSREQNLLIPSLIHSEELNEFSVPKGSVHCTPCTVAHHPPLTPNQTKYCLPSHSWNLLARFSK